MLTLNDGRTELWQWDTGRKLTVDADCSQVHFSNKVFGRSIDVDVVDGTAAIPDVLLQVDNELIAWAFVGTPENGYTKISKIFKVNRRNKPADYVFTPHEQTTLAEIMERLDDLESIQDPDAIKNAVDDYLANNPIKVNETDPTVSDWAKQPEKPSYTADEVGALSKTELSGAVNDALAQAKESGEFDGKDGTDGKDGYTPHKGIDYFDGKDYILTEADKSEIAEMAAELVEVPEAPEVSMKPLTFTGAVNATYDGSKAVSVEIPKGGGGGGGGAVKAELVYSFVADGETMSAFASVGEINEGDVFAISAYTQQASAVANTPIVHVRFGTSEEATYLGTMVGALNGTAAYANKTSFSIVTRKGNTFDFFAWWNNAGQTNVSAGTKAKYDGNNIYIYSATADTPIVKGTTVNVYKLA